MDAKQFKAPRDRNNDAGPPDPQLPPTDPVRAAGALLRETTPVRQSGPFARNGNQAARSVRRLAGATPDAQKAIDATFQDMFNLNGEKGPQAITNGAAWQIPPQGEQPAFEIVLVYFQEENAIDRNFRDAKKPCSRCRP